MSYNWSYGEPTTYRPYDLLALSWIYGGDGIGGTWGLNSTNGPVVPPEAYPPVTHSIIASGDTTRPESDASFSFTVLRGGNVSVATTVAWAVSGAVDAADFGGTLPSGVVSFAAGETSKTVTISAVDDDLLESTENFSVTLGARTGNGALLAEPSSVEFSILDNDTPPVIDISPEAQAAEGNAGGGNSVVFTVSRSGNLGKVSEVQWGYGAGSASADDFAGGVPAGGTLSFAPGEATKTIAVAIAGDTRIEPDETFFIQITPTRFGTPGNTRGTGLIVNDDIDNTVSVAARSASMAEGNSGTQAVEFVFTRSGNTSGTTSVGWTRQGSIGADDLVSAPDSGTVTFNPGQTSQVVHFDVKGDTHVEADEALTVTLTAATGLGAGLGAATSATTTITNDDPKAAVSVSVARASVAEGAPGTTLTHTFTLTRGGNLDDAATMPWHIGGDVDAADFPGNTVPTGNASFAAGAASTTVSVVTSGDSLYEADETLTLVLGEGDVVTPSATQGSASVILLNDDVPNEYRVAISGAAAINEGSAFGAKSSVRLIVSRVGDLTTPGTVDYQVKPSGDNPVAASDFDAAGLGYPHGTLSFAAGESSKTLFVYWLQDKTPEGDETFSVALLNPVGAGVSATQGSVQATIVNDDPLPSVSVAASATQLPEGQSGTTALGFDVQRSGDTSAAGSVHWSVAGTGAHAADAADFAAGQAMSGTLNFAAGQTHQSVTVLVQGDTTVEPDESFTLALDHAVAMTISATAGSASVTVLNDDAAHRTITGTAATNEKLTLHGPRADYTVTYDATDDHVKVSDHVAGRDGEIDLSAVEVLQFSASRLEAVPTAAQKGIVELGQVVLGSSGGLTTALWGNCVDYVAHNGVAGLGVLAAQAIYAGYSAHDLAVAVLYNLGANAATLGGADPQASYNSTVAMLSGMFTGDDAGRGQALAAVATALGGLEGDAVYGRVATAYNDHIGAQWIAQFAEHPVTLAGLPGPLVEVPMP